MLSSVCHLGEALLPKRIFIVDDSNLIRKSVRSQLESRLQHITCVEATNGVDAMQRINEVQPDIVVLDLCMPELNGVETAAALHDVFPMLPIILYTLHKDDRFGKASGGIRNLRGGFKVGSNRGPGRGNSEARGRCQSRLRITGARRDTARSTQSGNFFRQGRSDDSGGNTI